MLALLSKVNQVLNSIQLANDNKVVSHADLQKHFDAVNLAVQYQLYQLDISLQTFKLILDYCACLSKTLGPSEVDQAGSLLHFLQVSLPVHP